MNELKLLPCPFCGSENIAVGSDKGTVYRHNTAFGDLTRSAPTVRWAYCVDCGCVAPAEKVNNFDGFYKPDEQEDALNRAISTWSRRAQPANDPLTIEQLRKMDGEPVWCADGEGHSCYCLVNAESEDCIDSECGAWCFEFYGMTGDGENGLHNMGWLAYGHKPGGEQT